MDIPVPSRRRKSRLAGASCALGVAGLLLGFVAGLPAIFCGHLARTSIRRNRALRGRGQALVGLILGYFTTFGSLALLVVLADLSRGRSTITVSSDQRRAEAQLREIIAKLELFRVMGGSYPTTEQGLQALVMQPTAEPLPERWRKHFSAIPRDPWGHEFLYEEKRGHEVGWFEVYSKGPDGLARTADDISTTALP